MGMDQQFYFPSSGVEDPWTEGDMWTWYFVCQCIFRYHYVIFDNGRFISKWTTKMGGNDMVVYIYIYTYVSHPYNMLCYSYMVRRMVYNERPRP